MDYLKRKVDAGADYICTQLFFDNRDFYDFRERCDLAGIKVPIVAGIMPITSQGRAWCGWPSWPWGATSRPSCCGPSAGARTTTAVARVGIHWATEQCRDLLAQRRPRHPLLHAEPLRRDAADLREPRRRGLRRAAKCRLGHGSY